MYLAGVSRASWQYPGKRRVLDVAGVRIQTASGVQAVARRPMSVTDAWWVPRRSGALRQQCASHKSEEVHAFGRGQGLLLRRQRRQTIPGRHARLIRKVEQQVLDQVGHAGLAGRVVGCEEHCQQPFAAISRDSISLLCSDQATPDGAADARPPARQSPDPG